MRSRHKAAERKRRVVMSKSFLTPLQIDQFRRDGVLVIKNFYRIEDIRAVQQGIYDIIGRTIRRHGFNDERDDFCGDNFDVGFRDLISLNRRWGGEIYDAVKQIPAFLRLVSLIDHERLFCELRTGATPGVAAGGYGIRIDNPYEDRYRALWHQEYPAQLRSLDGLVFWSPLVPITPQIGPISVCIGSHNEGPLPVFSNDPEGSGRVGAYSLRIVNESRYLARYPKIEPLTEPTDLMVLDFLVLHASGHNTSDRSRWSMQFRYFNFADPTGSAHGWRGSYASGVDFRDVHPELFVEEGEP